MKIDREKLTEEQLREIKKILIIQHKPFGDILLNTGYLPELRKHFPSARIDYLIQKPYVTVLEDNPYIDNLIIKDKVKKKNIIRRCIVIIKTIKKIRSINYDLIIDQLRGTSSVRMVFFSGAKYRLGSKLKPRVWHGIKLGRWNWIYNLRTKRGKNRYYSRLKFDLLRPLGITEVEHNTQYYVKAESHQHVQQWIKESDLEDQELIVFSPGTPVRQKQWSLDYYAELADIIQTHLNFKILILWGPNEREDAEYIKDKAKTNIIITPPTTFNQAAALLHHVKVLICNDGGINHLAVSQETPSLAIFGAKTNPIRWVAWHKPNHTFLKDWKLTNLNDNTFNITPQMVYQKLLDMLNNKDNKNLNDVPCCNRKQGPI